MASVFSSSAIDIREFVGRVAAEWKAVELIGVTECGVTRNCIPASIAIATATCATSCQVAQPRDAACRTVGSLHSPTNDLAAIVVAMSARS